MAIKINWDDIYTRFINGEEVEKVMVNWAEIRPEEVVSPYWTPTTYFSYNFMDKTESTILSDWTQGEYNQRFKKDENGITFTGYSEWETGTWTMYKSIWTIWTHSFIICTADFYTTAPHAQWRPSLWLFLSKDGYQENTWAYILGDGLRCKISYYMDYWPSNIVYPLQYKLEYFVDLIHYSVSAAIYRSNDIISSYGVTWSQPDVENIQNDNTIWLAIATWTWIRNVNISVI